MNQRIESDALDLVTRILGITGATGLTLLDDGNVSQVLELGPIIRRSRTPGITTGWFNCFLQNVHGAAGSLHSEIDPYNAGDSAVAPYPAAVPQGFDFWVLYASLRRQSGAGTLDGAVFYSDPGAQQQGWGENDSGAAVASTLASPLALWTGLDTSITLTNGIGVSGDGSTMVKIGRRIPRGVILEFDSDVAGAAATILLSLTCGLFPEALGQDIAV